MKQEGKVSGFVNDSISNVIQVCPDNRHYFMYKGKPVLLITSAEHYGAQINPDFDIGAYLETLAAFELNYTRIYPGAYIEVEGMFIQNNTLAPVKGRHLLPWNRSAEPGCWDGGNKYDLAVWSKGYFDRLEAFLQKASDLDIIVEICLFNCQYRESWHACPLNAANNLQGIGPLDFNDFQTLKSPELVAEQDRYVAKIVQAVNRFDNVILEICDEPTLNGTPIPLAVDWVSHLADVILETEKGLPKRHLIAQQVMNGVNFSDDQRVDVITTQYIRQNCQQVGGVEALGTVYHLDKPIELNETAYYPIWYKGDAVAASRAEAWEFMVGGGAAFNQLNGHFTVLNPRGDTPDNLQVLGALRSLKAFLGGFDFAHMQKDTSFLLTLPMQNALVQGMSQPGRQYVLYFHHGVMQESGTSYEATPGTFRQELQIKLQPGNYRADWVDPRTNEVLASNEVIQGQAGIWLNSPMYTFDIALRILAIQ